MTAREDIADRLWWAAPSIDTAGARAKAEAMLDAYAHELAEKQREAAKGRFAGSSWATWWRRKSWLEAADLIDPEVPTEAEPPELLCRCGHGSAYHDAKYNDPQCRLCPEDGERSWRHSYTPEVST